MKDINTKHILAVISIADIIWGSHGAFAFLLWGGYGFYKIITSD